MVASLKLTVLVKVQESLQIFLALSSPHTCTKQFKNCQSTFKKIDPFGRVENLRQTNSETWYVSNFLWGQIETGKSLTPTLFFEFACHLGRGCITSHPEAAHLPITKKNAQPRKRTPFFLWNFMTIFYNMSLQNAGRGKFHKVHMVFFHTEST